MPGRAAEWRFIMNERCDRNERNRRNNPGGVTCCTVDNDNSEAEAAAAAAADTAAEAVETRRRRSSEFSEPVCISGNQIYDSCRDRDCVSDARVYLTAEIGRAHV